MNPTDFHHIIRNGKSNQFTIIQNNYKFEQQTVIVVSNEDSASVFIHSESFSKSLDIESWRMTGESDKIILTNIYTKEILQFDREL